MSNYTRQQFTLASGASINLPIQGRAITCTVATYPFTIKTDKGSTVEIERGIGLDFEPFKSVFIVNTADYSQEIVLYIGDATVRDSRLSIPNDTTVRVVDGARDQTDNGSEYIGFTGIGPVAAQYSHVQIFNPAASGVKLYINSVGMGGDGTTNTLVGVYRHNTAIGAEDLPPRSMIESGVFDDTTEVRYLTHATSQGVAADFQCIRRYADFETTNWNLTAPLLLGENEGLLLVTNAVNSNFNIQFDYSRLPL